MAISASHIWNVKKSKNYINNSYDFIENAVKIFFSFFFRFAFLASIV